MPNFLKTAIFIIILIIHSASLIAAPNNLTPIKITIAHFPEHLPAAIQAVSHIPCEKNTDYYQNNNQVVMETLLFCQALVLAGYRPTFEFVGMSVPVRVAREVASGRILSAGFGMWDNHFDKSTMYKSPNLIDPGDFEKGFYVSPSNKKILAVRSAKELRKYIGVSNPNWKQDWEGLECAGMNVIATLSMPSMFQMVGTGRVDYMITTFTKYDDLNQNHFGQELIPIPGFKIVFNNSLSFLISKKHPQGKILMRALNRGINILKKEGKVRAAYKTLAFHLDAVKDWENLGCKK